VAVLDLAGYPALHVGEIGLRGAPDEDVLEAAKSTGRVLVSADNDFGELLSRGQHILPSVILLRAPATPSDHAQSLLTVLDQQLDALAAGALVVVGPRGNVRVRPLPVAQRGSVMWARK
jgi:predicted nuclease of predicted toxin-antitoxin system